MFAIKTPETALNVMQYQTLNWRVDAGILTLTLNRPEKMNAFTVQMSHELIAAFARASEDDDVHAVVLTGAGNAFCAGMDFSVSGNVFGLNDSLRPTVADMHQRFNDPTIHDGVRDTGGKVALAIYECKKPVIAAINGVAVGVGITMTLAADIRIASQTARIGFVFGKIGIVPEACSSWFLPRLVGMQQALEWIYRADVFDASEALQGGLLKAVHAPEDLLDAAYKLARKFTERRSPMATALARQMLWRNSMLPSPLDAHRIDSLAVFYAQRVDGKEGVQAFLEKREPQFTSKASAMPPFYPWWL